MINSDHFVRFVVYGLLGWCVELTFTGVKRVVFMRKWDATGTSYLWMHPVYGLMAFLYEPVHDYLHGAALPIRSAIWAIGFTSVEWAAGYLIASVVGRCPWDYSQERFAINQYIRWDFLPIWAAFGLLMEPVHSFLVLLTPHIRASFHAVF